MHYEELTNTIKLAPKENEQWDFKEKWHESNGELLRDIINFTNTPSHNDAYIIFGISDQDGSVIGIDKNDPNRKNKQQLQDYLRNIPFAQNYYPKTNVETLEVNEKEIDILTIYNTDDVPLFLARDVARVDNNNKQKKKGKPLRRGLIYSRIGDSNTPVDQSTTDEQMERLWQKRFRLDVSIYDRFKYILKDYNNWTYVPRLDNVTTYYIYTKDPDFVIEEAFDETLESRDAFVAYSLSQLKARVGWNIVRLKYRGTTLYDNLYNCFDNATFGAVIPDDRFIKIQNKDYSSGAYFYYLKDDFPFLITMLIASLRGSANNERAQFTFEMFKKNVLCIENESQRLTLENETQKYLKDNVSKVIPNAGEIESIKSKMKLDIGMKDRPKYDDSKVANMTLDNKLTQLMIELYSSDRYNNEL